jgi:hypothetical protein
MDLLPASASTDALGFAGSLGRVWRLFWDALGRPSRAYPMVALSCGLVLVCSIPPFGGPDETTHFFRAYQLSTPRVVPPTNQVGFPMARMPHSLQPCLTTIGRIVFRDSLKITPNERSACWTAESDGLKSEYECTACWYSPLAYLGQTLAVALGRLLNLRPILLLYLARVGGLVTGVSLVTLAIRVAPCFQRSLLLLALLPMALEQFAIVTADTVLIGVGFLLFAVVLRIAHDYRRHIEPKWWIIALLSAVVLGSLKPPYVAPLLLLAASQGDFGRRRIPWIMLAVGGAVALASFLVWQRFGFSTVAYYVATRPVGEAERIIDGFWPYTRQVFADHGFFLLESFIGRAGWLDVREPQSFTLLVWAMLAIGVVTDAPLRGNPLALRAVAGLAFALGTTAVIYATYRFWQPNPGNVHGRYLMPLTPCAAVALASPALRPESDPARPNRVFALLSVLNIAIMAHYIGVRYYG